MTKEELMDVVREELNDATREAWEAGRLQGLEEAALALETHRDIGHEVCAFMFAARIRSLTPHPAGVTEGRR